MKSNEITENKLIFGEDYCFYIIATPRYFKNVCGWEPESGAAYGEYKTKREKSIRYFWHNNFTELPYISTMSISEKAFEEDKVNYKVISGAQYDSQNNSCNM